MNKNYIIICLAIVVVVMIVGLGILINRQRSTGLVNDNVVVMKNNTSINVEKVNTGMFQVLIGQFKGFIRR